MVVTPYDVIRLNWSVIKTFIQNLIIKYFLRSLNIFGHVLLAGKFQRITEIAITTMYGFGQLLAIGYWRYAEKLETLIEIAYWNALNISLLCLIMSLKWYSMVWFDCIQRVTVFNKIITVCIIFLKLGPKFGVSRSLWRHIFLLSQYLSDFEHEVLKAGGNGIEHVLIVYLILYLN